MKPNRIYITGLFLSVFLSGKAQRIEELPAVPLQIGYEKTLHLIFPTEVKYYSIGGDYVIGEKVGNCPEIIRLKAAEENFPGETTLSVVTADTKFYSYAISQHSIKHTFLSSLCISYVGLQFKRINIINSHEAFYTTSIHIICETNSRISSIFQLYHINLV